MGEKPEVSQTQDPAPATDPVADQTMVTEMNNMFKADDGHVADTSPENAPDVQDLESKVASLEEVIKAKNEAQENNNKILEAIKESVGPKSTEKTQEEKLADMMYTDPVGYTKALKELAKEEVRGERLQEKSNSNWWEGFYQRNPDLKNQKVIVDMISQADKDSLAGMTPDAAEKIIIEKARNIISGVTGGKNVKTETVNPGSAEVLSSSHGPQGNAPVNAKPKTFIDQIKEWQKK